MREPDTDVFHAEHVTDELGEGVRLYTAADDIYEMRADDGVETRIYREEETWCVKVREPVPDDLEAAYEVFRDTAHRIGDAYGWDVTVPAYDFMDGDHRLDLEPVELSGSLRYRQERQIDLSIDVPKKRRHSVLASLGSLTIWEGLGGGIGAAVGGGLGLVAGVPVEGAMLGSAVGGGGGSFMWLVDQEDTYRKGNPEAPTYGIREDIRERARRKKEEAMREADELEEGAIIERVNERNRLNAEINTVEDFGQAERLKDLQEEAVGETFDALMAAHFNQFHQWDGVIADVEVDAYADAYRFAASVAETRQEAVERPSIYTDRDAFGGVFEALPDADRDVLVANVLERGASDAVTAYLDSEHAERVQRVGGATVLDAGTEEGGR